VNKGSLQSDDIAILRATKMRKQAWNDEEIAEFNKAIKKAVQERKGENLQLTPKKITHSNLTLPSAEEMAEMNQRNLAIAQQKIEKKVRIETKPHSINKITKFIFPFMLHYIFGFL